jgi:hypothetical protein
MQCCVRTARIVTQTSQNVTRLYTANLVEQLKSSILFSYRPIKGVITIGVTWRGGGGGSTMDCNLRSSQVRNKGMIGLNQSLIHIHVFNPLSPQFFNLPPPPFNSVAKRKLSLDRKNNWGGGAFAAPPLSYAYDYN